MGWATEIGVRQTEPATVAFIATKGLLAQAAECFGRLCAWIGQRGCVPSGPPSGVCFDLPGQLPEGEPRWELRSPTAGNVAESGPDEEGSGVKAVGPALVAPTVHRGPCEDEAGVHEALVAWVAQNGYQVAGPVEEVHLTDPSRTAPESLLKEVRFRIRKLR